MDNSEIRHEIERLVTEYFRQAENKDIVPVRYGGSIHDEKEAVEMINAVLDGWWVNGRRSTEFEDAFKRYINTKYAVFCNSGSSALMLAFDALGLERGSEVISPALTFPTTINPAIRAGMKVVLVDSDIGTYNINVDELEKSVTDDTKVLILPYIMGNMSDIDRIMEIVEDNNIVLVEDCCEAMGSRYKGKILGSFGVGATFSLYPSHHISAAGGGVFTTNNDEIYFRALSLKNWGRRYSQPEHIPNQKIIRSDYVQQYTYDTIGYNFNANEIMAAKGLSQMKKLDEFNKSREKNFDILMKFFGKYKELFILPEVRDGAQPSWFAFPLTIRTENAKFTREQLMDFLFKRKIETRYILCGNIVKQPAYSNVKFVFGALPNANRIHTDSFFIGLYHGINKDKMKYMQDSFEEFLGEGV